MTSIPEALGWTLIHLCWQAGAVAAAYYLLSIALARRSAESRYLAALSSLLVLFALAAGTFAWEFDSDHVLLTSQAASNLSAPLTVNEPQFASPGRLASPTQLRHVTLSNILPWIDGLWLAGVLALSVRSLGGWWYLRHLRLSAIALAPPAVRASFDRICKALDLHRAVALRLSDGIDSPMTMGALRAVVLVPLSAITSLGPEELEVVLAHELAHVRRADFFWNILQTIAETLFFFHPAVWWISVKIRHERELCCDDLALKICPNPVTYAHALYRLEEHRSRHLRLAMALDGHASQRTLLIRIARILGEPMTRVSKSRLRPISLAATCAGLVVLLVPLPRLMASLNQATEPPSRPMISSTPQPTMPVDRGPARVLRAGTPSRHAAEQASLASDTTSTVQQHDPQSSSEPGAAPQPHSDYIERMKAAGYDVDLDKLIAMKIQGITPEYARAIAEMGFGKPSADDLLACKIQGVTPEYISQLRQQGFAIDNLQDVISFRIFGLTPEFVSGMKAAGFNNLTTKQLLGMRVQGVTPEYARTLKRKFPDVTSDELVQARIFRIDDDFIAEAGRHGFSNLSFKKLVQLRISGLLDDESVKP